MLPMGRTYAVAACDRNGRSWRNPTVARSSALQLTLAIRVHWFLTGLRCDGERARPLARRFAGVRKPPKNETACGKGAGAVGAIYGDLGMAGCGRPALEAKINRALAGFGGGMARIFPASGFGLACVWRGYWDGVGPANKGRPRWRLASDEAADERSRAAGGAKENALRQSAFRTQCRADASQALERMRRAANASPSITRGGSHMREFHSYGPEGGAQQ